METQPTPATIPQIGHGKDFLINLDNLFEDPSEDAIRKVTAHIERIGGIPEKYKTTTDFLGQETEAIKLSDDTAQTIIIVQTPALTKTKGQIIEVAKLGGGIIYTSTIRTIKKEASQGTGEGEGTTQNIGYVENYDIKTGSATISSDPHTKTASLVNNFGVHSLELTPEYATTLKEAQDILANDNQTLIVSFIGTAPTKETTLEEYIEDWKKGIRILKEAGIKNVELNLANPHIPENFGACEGSQYKNVDMMKVVIEKVMTEAGPEMNIGANIRAIHTKTDKTQIDKTRVKEIIETLHQLKVKFISIMNTNPLKANDKTGEPHFGNNRPNAGISGEALNGLSNQMAKVVAQTISNLNSEMVAIYNGGITGVESAKERIKTIRAIQRQINEAIAIGMTSEILQNVNAIRELEQALITQPAQ